MRRAQCVFCPFLTRSSHGMQCPGDGTVLSESSQDSEGPRLHKTAVLKFLIKSKNKEQKGRRN